MVQKFCLFDYYRVFSLRRGRGVTFVCAHRPVCASISRYTISNIKQFVHRYSPSGSRVFDNRQTKLIVTIVLLHEITELFTEFTSRCRNHEKFRLSSRIVTLYFGIMIFTLNDNKFYISVFLHTCVAVYLLSFKCHTFTT